MSYARNETEQVESQAAPPPPEAAKPEVTSPPGVLDLGAEQAAVAAEKAVVEGMLADPERAVANARIVVDRAERSLERYLEGQKTHDGILRQHLTEMGRLRKALSDGVRAEQELKHDAQLLKEQVAEAHQEAVKARLALKKAESALWEAKNAKAAAEEKLQQRSYYLDKRRRDVQEAQKIAARKEALQRELAALEQRGSKLGDC